jgi:uncharacterized protein YndB with AHSA1/START domain
MSVIDVTKDLDALTMTIAATFDAPVERVWQVWADPRLLERWWGPPTHPATVVEHDLAPGGRVGYYMTGPDGTRHAGYWRVLAVEPPRLLEFSDGFADEHGNPNPELPTTTTAVSLTRAGEGTRMVVRSVFPNRAEMDQLLAMEMEEGIRSAMAQIDGILAEGAAA